MRNRYPILLTTVEEDFKRIGLLPQDQISEVDDPQKPRDIPSPDPSTLDGLDDSEGDKSAHQAGAKQPKPKMGPPADDAEKAGMDPDKEGGSAGAHKGESGKYHKVAGGKEASLESKQYMLAKKQPGVKGSGKNKGQKPAIAQGLKPAKRVGGMHEGRFVKAASLVEEVHGLLRGVQTSEEMDDLMRGFRLVAEDASLLSDRLTEIADKYEVEEIVSKMESLSVDAVEALSVIESELEHVGDDGDEAAAIAHSGDVADVESVDQADGKSDRDADEPYDIPSPAFKEQAEMVLAAMVHQLMEALEAYDSVVEEMYPGMSEEDDDGDDGHEVHVHAHGAKRVHVHAHADTGDDAHGDDAQGDDDQGDDDDGGMDGDDGDMDHDDMDHDDGSGDMDDEPDHDSDHDRNSIMAKMKMLKARRSAMKGGRPFRGDEEESY